MNAPVKISDLLDAQTSALVKRAAMDRGMSVGDYIAEAVQRLADDDAALSASLDEANRAVERGEYFTQEEVEAWFAARRGTAAGE